MSALNTILDAVVNQVGSLGISFNGAIQVVKRKLPKKGETVDPVPQITVSNREQGEDFKWYTFSNGLLMVYYIEVTIIAANNRDQLTNIPNYAQWREQIRTLFARPLLNGAPTVWDMRVIPKVFLDRRMISDNYDYQQLVVQVKSAERGSI